MPLENGNFIADLDATNPLGGDTTNEGDDHLRLVKSILKKQFPGTGGQGFNKAIVASEDDLNATSNATSNFQAQIDALSAQIGGLVGNVVAAIYPVGSLYSSTLNQNPTAILGVGVWAPYAAGRVMVGVDTGDADFNVGGMTGGSKDASLPIHSHTARTLTDGDHTHTTQNGSTLNSAINNGGVAGTVTKTGASNVTNAGGAHQHTVDVDDSGTSPVGANMPPYITVYTWIRNA